MPSQSGHTPTHSLGDSIGRLRPGHRAKWPDLVPPLLVIEGRSAPLDPRHAAAAGGVDGFPRNKYRRCPIRESSCVIGVSVVLTDTHQERRQCA